jgi:very-short-patch-repair endonuclease
MRNELAGSGPDAAIARLAANQHGVVTAAQIQSASLSPAAITRRLAAGRLHRIHRGVYAVGHRRLSDEGRWLAAVLACGNGAVLSHRSAAQLWDIRCRVRRRSKAGGGGVHLVEVTVPGYSGHAKRRGIKLYRSATLLPEHCTRRAGIPVTRPSRTLEDLRSVLSSPQVAAAVREAEFLGLPVGEQFVADGPRTELEDRMLSVCRRHRLPRPEVNTLVDRFEVDFLWRGQRLVAEVDGWDSHHTRSAFEEDRARDARLKLLGYEVVRFTWRQVTEDASMVAKTIRTLLAVR